MRACMFHDLGLRLSCSCTCACGVVAEEERTDIIIISYLHGMVGRSVLPCLSKIGYTEHDEASGLRRTQLAGHFKYCPVLYPTTAFPPLSPHVMCFLCCVSVRFGALARTTCYCPGQDLNPSQNTTDDTDQGRAVEWKWGKLI